MMDTLHASAEWKNVGDNWYRTTQQYTEVFDQDLDLDNYVVAGAPFAGALGMFYLGNPFSIPRASCYGTSTATSYSGWLY